METVAVFWESKIRTYGFELREGLTLMEVALSAEGAVAWGSVLSELAEQCCRFEWVAAKTIQGSNLHFRVVCDASNAEILKGLMVAPTTQAAPWPNESPTLVDMIRFHGPHYGDRYGIADFALEALAKADIVPIVMTCAISGISLVMAAGVGSRAVQVLEAAFEIPRKTRSDRKRSDNEKPRMTT